MCPGQFHEFSDPEHLFGHLDAGRTGVLLMLAPYDADGVVTALALAYDNVMIQRGNSSEGAVNIDFHTGDHHVDGWRLRRVRADHSHI